MQIKQEQLTDGQGHVASNQGDLPFYCEKEITFDGATENAWGDDGGTLDGGSLFDVTGTVEATIIGIVETTLVGAATANVGTSKDAAGLIAQVANTTALAVNEIWHDATPDASVELATVKLKKIIANGLDILFYNGTANITAGKIKFLVSWFPLSADGNVTPSTN